MNGGDGVLTYGDVAAELARGNRVLLLVRHAERPRIDHEDRTFGGALPITANGMRMSEAFGGRLRGLTDDVQFRASPLRRTVMTAEGIARGMGLAGAEIPTDDRIGNGIAFIADRLRVWELFRDGSFFEKTIAYMTRGTQDGFNPIGPAADAFERYVLGLFRARLGIFTTHDLYVAAYTHVRGVKRDWSPDNWPRFMDAAAIVVEPSGRRRYGLLRAGLSDRAIGVD